MVGPIRYKMQDPPQETAKLMADRLRWMLGQSTPENFSLKFATEIVHKSPQILVMLDRLVELEKKSSSTADLRS